MAEERQFLSETPILRWSCVLILERRSNSVLQC